MYETLSFPVAHCETCQRRVLVASALDANDDIVEVCSHCESPIGDQAERKAYGGYALKFIGYDVDGEGQEQRGCGSGGCSTGGCGTGGCSVH